MPVTLAGRLESLGRARSLESHSISIPPPNFLLWLSLPSSPTLHPLTAPPDANPTQRSIAVSATFPRCGPFPGQRIKRVGYLRGLDAPLPVGRMVRCGG